MRVKPIGLRSLVLLIAKGEWIMKTTIKLLTVLTLAVFGQHTTASAGGGTNNGHCKDLGANAYFYSTDPSGCVVTEAYIFATQHYFQSPPGPGSEGPFVSLLIFKNDVCSATELLNASGSATNINLQVDKKLNWTTLIATVNVWEGVSQTFQDIYLDMAWTGVGPSTHLTDHFHFNSPTCHMMTRSNGVFRSANAWSSISDGVTNFTPEPAQGAEIFSTRSGNLTVGCS
jgi:hypothetical protein